MFADWIRCELNEVVIWVYLKQIIVYPDTVAQRADDNDNLIWNTELWEVILPDTTCLTILDPGHGEQQHYYTDIISQLPASTTNIKNKPA